MSTTPRAQFVQPGTGIPIDPSHLMDIVELSVVDDRLSVLVSALRVGMTGSDVDLRAEHRIWGSYPHAMAAMTHPLEHDERRATTLRTAGSVIPADRNGYVLDADPRKGRLHAAGQLPR